MRSHLPQPALPQRPRGLAHTEGAHFSLLMLFYPLVEINEHSPIALFLALSVCFVPKSGCNSLHSGSVDALTVAYCATGILITDEQFCYENIFRQCVG